jgi:hypothetical protein
MLYYHVNNHIKIPAQMMAQTSHQTYISKLPFKITFNVNNGHNVYKYSNPSDEMKGLSDGKQYIVSALNSYNIPYAICIENFHPLNVMCHLFICKTVGYLLLTLLS